MFPLPVPEDQPCSKTPLRRRCDSRRVTSHHPRSPYHLSWPLSGREATLEPKRPTLCLPLRWRKPSCQYLTPFGLELHSHLLSVHPTDVMISLQVVTNLLCRNALVSSELPQRLAMERYMSGRCFRISHSRTHILRRPAAPSPCCCFPPSAAHLPLQSPRRQIHQGPVLMITHSTLFNTKQRL